MSESVTRSVNSKGLPWWTWIAPFILIEAGDLLSLLFRYSQNFSAFYLPTAVGLVLIQWWGPKRVLPSLFIITTLNSWYYGIEEYWLWFAYGLAESFAVFLSWYLFVVKAKGKIWLPDTRNTLLFLAFSLVLPVLFEVAVWEFLYIANGSIQLSDYWNRFNRDILSELIVNLSFGMTALYFLTPKMHYAGLLLRRIRTFIPQPKPITKSRIEIGSVLIILLVLVFFLPFQKFWFVYGFFSFYLAIRFGFGMALAGNAYLFFISYLLPLLLVNLSIKKDFPIDVEATNTYLGTLLLYVFAIVTGRIISDLRIVEAKLNDQNLELKETNQELDRFVYSVSHDLSAPLKSISGLVNISKITTNADDHRLYFDKIGASVAKLDAFIKEVLEYSQNSRRDIIVEQVELKELCNEIFENLRYMENFSMLKIDYSNLHQKVVLNDKSRLKIILNNLLTNAVKYQQYVPGHEPYIKVSSQRVNNVTVIEVEDNGEGIRPEVQSKIFTMFFRGHERSVGSGLGLYIAKEAAEKIAAKISVRSEFGTGSTFSVELSDLIPS